MLTKMIDLVTLGVRDWMVQTNTALQTTLRSLFSFSDPAGPFGRLVAAGWQFSLSLCAGFIGLALTIAFAQRWLVAIAPGIVKMVPLEAIIVRSFLVAVLIGGGAYVRQWMGQVLELAFRLPWQILVSGGDPWSWTVLFMLPFNGPLTPGLGVGMLVAMVLAAAGYVLTVLALLFLFFMAILAIAALPLAATAWLYTFSEGLWSQYWWFLIKVALAPAVIAIFTRLDIEMLQLMSSSLLIGAWVSLIHNMVMLWTLFKLITLSMPLVAVARSAGWPCPGMFRGLTLLSMGLSGMGARGAARDTRGVGRALKLKQKLDGEEGGV
jgi:hypothetical protein